MPKVNAIINTEIKLTDGDYTLDDGAAWFTVGPYSVRIRRWTEEDVGEPSEPGLEIRVYPVGEEMEEELTYVEVFDHELEE